MARPRPRKALRLYTVMARTPRSGRRFQPAPDSSAWEYMVGTVSGFIIIYRSNGAVTPNSLVSSNSESSTRKNWRHRHNNVKKPSCVLPHLIGAKK